MRKAVVLGLLLALGGGGCMGDDDNGDGGSTSNRPPQEIGDAFVADLLAGQPGEAANRLNPIRAELEPQLPGISIQLQSGGYKVVNVKRQGNNAFVYTFEGDESAQPRRMEWVMTFANDVGQWGVVTFGPPRDGPQTTSPE
jgi:hypothetical protein